MSLAEDNREKSLKKHTTISNIRADLALRNELEVSKQKEAGETARTKMSNDTTIATNKASIDADAATKAANVASVRQGTRVAGNIANAFVGAKNAQYNQEKLDSEYNAAGTLRDAKADSLNVTPGGIRTEPGDYMDVGNDKASDRLTKAGYGRLNKGTVATPGTGASPTATGTAATASPSALDKRGKQSMIRNKPNTLTDTRNILGDKFKKNPDTFS